MEKVMCVKCGSIGYTASPSQVFCELCGGRHMAIKNERSVFQATRRCRVFILNNAAQG